mmetsp:Transcript_45723/g.97480  ORF Transcript_45723/g.97480 Transcript_45723/m.97480 type:complete len:286 (-) Transcript_45723:269-1126(-)|eukprot:CAMPEP_0183340932 /NCGR_PEP_ID=MMETSP0164_2-20130417/7317_1 /TAXON_ID=221442 /ORGANISM="Coccolithus pelagicus ssp braarudi, Strain PLY182g" /LENGTH=285 /DNA_ID=CAMNT_0025511145 /DNA_START=156 /DNA_END=1013 /DNA_ORIENTATION=+
MTSPARLAARAARLIGTPESCLAAKREHTGWRSYMLDRGWLRRDDFLSAPVSNQQAALGLLSAMLTYPLTLASRLDTIFPIAGRSPVLRFCVIGARAEATLPPFVWTELCSLSQRGAALEMVGPKSAARATPTARHMRDPRLSIVQGAKGAMFHQTLTGRALLTASQGSKQAADLPDLPDAFVLFNPGFGEPGWAPAWEPTVRAVIRSGKPVVLSALSERDAEQDSSFWHSVATSEMGSTCSLDYSPNCWRSLLHSTHGEETRFAQEDRHCNSLVASFVPKGAAF